MNSNDDPQIIHNDIKKRDWMVEDLNEEIKKKYPSKEEISVDNTIGEWKGDLDAFKQKCAAVFPINRVFMSQIQLLQETKFFL